MKPTLSYIICSLPRSGTHLLGDALQQTGVAGRPDEYFIVDKHGRLQNEQGHIADLYGKKDLIAFRDLVWELGSTPNGVFGITIMGPYLKQVIDNYHKLPPYKGLNTHELLAALFNNPRYIWLIRQDKVKQAISHFKAGQTGVWAKPKGVRKPVQQTPLFDYANVEDLRQKLVAGDARWGSYFRRYGIEPLTLYYEEMVENLEDTAVTVLDFLEISLPEEVSLKKSRLQKQANQINEMWERKYYQIHHSRAPKVALWLYKARAWVGKITVRRWLRQGWGFLTDRGVANE